MSAPASPSDTLSGLNTAAEAIWLAASPAWPTLSLEVLPEATSTNSLLMARGRQGDTAPVAMVAARQTAGRGRQGRTWLAEAGRCLTFSVGLPIDLEAVPGGGSTLSLVVGVALARSLQRWRQPQVPGLGLKWPNDLLWQGRKLAGILIEATPAPGLSGGERWVVIGVGLNTQPPLSVAAQGFAALSDIPSAQPDADVTVGAAWSRLVPDLLDAIRSWSTQGFAPWQAAFAELDVLAGQDVKLLSPTQDILGTGQAVGVDTDGALLVHTPTGTARWTSGEVSVRAIAWPSGPVPPATPAA